jgi:signal transduction histidine kinase
VSVLASVLLLRRAADAVDHTQEVRLAISRLETTLMRAQSAQRGYIVTGDPVFLKPLDDAAVAWRRDVDRLAELTSDNPDQQRAIAELDETMQRRFVELRATARTRAEEGFEAAAPDVERDVAQTPTRKLLALTARMDATETRLMAERRRRAQMFNVAALAALIVAATAASTAIYLAQRRRADAERMAELGESFVALLGHDLRNPLNAIVTGADLLARNSDERTTRVAERISRSATRMTRMIAQVLDLTRIRLVGGLPLRRTDMDLAETARLIVDELHAAHPECELVLDAAGEARGQWDEDRIQQLLSNLIGNALQHGEGGSKVAVRVDGTAPAEVRIAVTNRGSIPADLREKLFDPFQRSSKRDGLGLGLYISREIARAHGGSLEIEPKGDETCLSVRLPREAPRQRAVTFPARVKSSARFRSDTSA